MDFHKAKNQFETKMTEIRRQISESREKIDQLTADYRASMTAYTLSGGKNLANTVAFARGSLAHEKQKLAELQEQAEILEAARAEELVATLPKLIQDNRAKIEQARKEYEKAAGELLKHRADTLLKLRSLWTLQQDARSTYGETVQAAQVAGVEFRDRFEMPPLNLFGQYGTKDSWLLPLGQEASVALHTGEVPAFVKLYALTGELVNENEASQRLRTMKEGIK